MIDRFFYKIEKRLDEFFEFVGDTITALILAPPVFLMIFIVIALAPLWIIPFTIHRLKR